MLGCLTKLHLVPMTMQPQVLCWSKRIVFMCRTSAQRPSFLEHWLEVRSFVKCKLCQKLATIASLCGMPGFREKYAQIDTIVDLWEKNISMVISAVEFRDEEPGKVKAFNENDILQTPHPIQADDPQQMAVTEDYPAPLDTEETNEEHFTQADHTLAAASFINEQMVTEEDHLPSNHQQGSPMIVTKDDCLAPYIELTEDSEQITFTSAAKSPLQRMVSREMSPVIKEGDSML